MSFQKITELLNCQAPITWFFYGDHMICWADHRSGFCDYFQLFREFLRTGLGRITDTVIDMANGGSSTKDLLNDFDKRVRRFSPDVIFLMTGMHDCRKDSQITLGMFSENLRKLTEKCSAIQALPVLQTACPVLQGSAPERESYFLNYMLAIRKIAKLQGIPLIDHTQYWLENPNKHSFWMSNEIYPNEDGHREFAYFLLKELGQLDASNPAQRITF